MPNLTRRSLLAGLAALPFAGLIAKPLPARKPAPFLIGSVRSARPAPVDSKRSIYQVHNGPVDAISAAWDGPDRIVFDRDVSDLAAYAPPPGTYATSLSSGMIRFGQAPTHGARVDAAHNG